MSLVFFKKELEVVFKQPMIYIFFLITALMAFGAVASSSIVIGGAVGNINKNAPTVVTTFAMILNVFGLLFATAFFNNAALRDFKYNFNEIMFSSPIDKASYFFGRFGGAWVASAFVLCGIFLGVVVGGFVGPALNWVSADQIGPIPWHAFLNNLLIFILPNMFVAGALIFTMASLSRSTVVSFVGSLLIIIGYIVSLNLMSDMENESLAGLLDIFGISANGLDTQYYTPQESNTLAPSLSGHTLKNRLLWTFVGAALLAVCYRLFSFTTKKKKVKKKNEKGSKSIPTFVAPQLADLSQPSAWAQFFTFFKVNFISILKSTVFIILVLFSVIILVSNLASGFEYFGLKSFPVTYKLVDQINGLTNLFVYIVIIFFSGELVWRDRDFHLNEVIDGTAHSSVVSLFAKTLSLILLSCILHFVFIGTAIAYQAINGYSNFELSVYLGNFFYNGFLQYCIFAGFLVCIQVFVNQKYLGYFVSILFIFVADLLLAALRIGSNMLSFGSIPSLRYSDMNSFGPGLLGAKWYSLYWLLLTFTLMLIGGILWARGSNKSISNRFKQGKKSLSKSYMAFASFIGVCWLVCTGFVYYNTQILNPYKNGKQLELASVAYENTYKQYEDLVKPKITDLTYYLDIYPEERKVICKSEITLVNKSDEDIKEIHLTLNDNWETEFVIPGATLTLNDEDLNYRIYNLSAPMKSGDTLQTVVHTKYVTQGFPNGRGSTNVIKNGTFLGNWAVLPNLGYSTSGEIGDKNLRKKYNLPIKDRMPKLEDNCTESCMKNYLSDGAADWVNVESFVSTSSDQIAIAPGSLINMEEANGRRTYHYKVDHPSMNFYSFISADYQVATRKWQGIDLEVYYHKGHEVNIERMLDAIQKSLEYYTSNFGPYYHKQARIIEFPRYSTFAQAFPGTMPYSEAFGFIIDLEDDSKNNVIDAVIAHEMAHQYWAHQVIGADMQGSTMLSESFSEYSALMVMKQKSDPKKMKEFLKYNMRRYLRGRAGESDKEVPLHKVENQAHIHYGKGSIILYALQEYIGEEKVNTAMREFLEKYRYADPPYPTSNDFLSFLEPQVPDSLQYVINDWIKDITLYDLRLKTAEYTERADGKFEIELSLENYKYKADTIGLENKVPINDWVDIGFYSDRSEEEIMFKERVLLNQAEQNLSFVLDSKPQAAIIDPFEILVERVSKDNIKSLSKAE